MLSILTRLLLAIIPGIALSGPLSGPLLATMPATADIEVTLSPQLTATGIHGLQVQAIYRPLQGGVNAPRLSLEKVLSNVRTYADRLQLESAQDASGSVTMQSQDGTRQGHPNRSWLAARPVVGALILRYRIPIDNQANALGAAPPFELRSDGQAMSGLLGTFLPLPDDSRSRTLAIHWQFAGAANRDLGVSTLGVGNTLASKPLDREAISNNFVMGGDLAHEPEQASHDGFFSVWQGQPPFDAHQLMAWTHRLYRYDLQFFPSSGSSYSIYLRPNLINAGGGVEVGKSFVGTFDDRTTVADFKFTLAHEMVHTFVGGLAGDDELGNSWFSEGLAVYYERELPLRAGLISRQDYLGDLNKSAARYYTDRLNDTPNSLIGSRFWQDTRVRVLPYDRGSLYFAQLNAELRHASQGKKGLDELLLPLLKRGDAGQLLTTDSWLAAVVGALGPLGKSQFEDMLAGKLISLDSTAFGAGYRRISLPLRRYELGFSPDVLVEPGRVVRGLIPGSAAARAGLHNGDHIVRPVPQDDIQGNQHALLTLQIERDGRPLTIRYLPRAESVPTYQWVMVPTSAQIAGAH